MVRWLIKIGDYIKHKDNGMIYKVISSSEKLLYITDCKQTRQHIGVDVATNNYIVVDYKQLYEQQKQRADELEKRWSELKDTVNEFHQEAIIEVSKCKDEGDKGIVYACEKILGKISDLEEDGE